MVKPFFVAVNFLDKKDRFGIFLIDSLYQTTYIPFHETARTHNRR